MTKEDVQKLVSGEVQKAMEPVVKQLQELNPVTKGAGEGEGAAAASADDGVTAEAVAKMVGEEVSKAIEPVMKALEPVLQSRALPGNLNDSNGAGISKSEESHYMTGMF